MTPWRRLAARIAAGRDDILVWSGVALVAVAAAHVHSALAIALVGAALVIDGAAGSRER